MPAGIYNARLLWLQAVKSIDTDNGSQIIAYTENGYLWCSVDEVSGRSVDQYGATVKGATVEIRIRNYPAISTDDLLKDEYFEQVYHIETVRQGNNEMIIDGYYNETLEDFNMETS